MSIYREFERTGLSFAERIGEPESTQIYAALGWIVSDFSELEDAVRNVIVLLSGADRKAAHIMTVQLSFRQKLDVMASLVKHRLPSLVELSMNADTEKEVRDVVLRCHKAEALRNTYIHSSYTSRVTGGFARLKASARAKHGFSADRENLDSGLLLDVSDYIASTANAVEGIPLTLEIADMVTAGEDYIRYTKNGSIVAEFRFGELE